MSEIRELTQDEFVAGLHPEDVVLDFASGCPPLPVSAVPNGTRFVAKSNGEYRLTRGSATTLEAPSETDNWSELTTLLHHASVRRVVCAIAGSESIPDPLRRQLADDGIDVALVVVRPSVDAGDFMNDEDTELVEQRLRELGYI